jgi:hypothetical protein
MGVHFSVFTVSCGALTTVIQFNLTVNGAAVHVASGTYFILVHIDHSTATPTSLVLHSNGVWCLREFLLLLRRSAC